MLMRSISSAAISPSLNGPIDSISDFVAAFATAAVVRGTAPGPT